MTHILQDVKGYLAVTAATKASFSSSATSDTPSGSTALVSSVPFVRLQLAVTPNTTLSAAPHDDESQTLSTELQMQQLAFASHSVLTGRTDSTTRLELDLTLPQAFQLLSELEDLQAKLKAMDDRVS